MDEMGLPASTCCLNFLIVCWLDDDVVCSKRFTCVEGRRRRSPLNLRSTTKECSRLNCATNGRRQGHAHTVTTASLLMALKSSAQLSVTLATRPRYAEWSLLVISVHTATAATSAMSLLKRKDLWANSSRGQSSLRGKIRTNVDQRNCESETGANVGNVYNAQREW